MRPIGLGARDSLRLEAGLPLNGHDIDETVSPIEASLGFAVAKPRLAAASLRGAARIARELAGELARKRVGLRVLEGAPAREGAEIADSCRRRRRAVSPPAASRRRWAPRSPWAMSRPRWPSPERR